MNLLNSLVPAASTSYRLSQELGNLGAVASLSMAYTAGDLPDYKNNDIITLYMPYGYRLHGRVISPSYTYKKTEDGGETFVNIEVRSEAQLMAQMSHSKTLRFYTMTQEEYSEFLDDYDPAKADFKPKIKLSQDEFGRYGWTACDIAIYLLSYLPNVQNMYVNVPNYWMSSFVVPMGSTIFSHIQELFNMFEPHILYDGSTIYILDRSLCTGYANYATISNTAITGAEHHEPYAVQPKYVRLEGSYGEFREDKYKNKISPDPAEMISILMPEVRYGDDPTFSIDVGYSYGAPLVELQIKSNMYRREDDKEIGVKIHGADAEVYDLTNIFEVSINVQYYLRNIFNKRGVLYEEANFVWKKAGQPPTVPGVVMDTWGKITDESAIRAGLVDTQAVNTEYFWGDLSTQEARNANDIYSSELVVRAWLRTTANYESPRQDSVGQFGFDLWDNADLWQPHTMKIFGGMGLRDIYEMMIDENESEEMYVFQFYPIGKVEFEGSLYTDNLSAWAEYPGVEIQNVKVTYAVVVASEEEMADEPVPAGSLIREGKVIPVLDVAISGNNTPEGGKLYPSHTADGLLLDNIDVASLIEGKFMRYSVRVENRQCLIGQTTINRSNITWKSYSEYTDSQTIDTNTGYTKHTTTTETFKAPPKQDKIEKRKMQVYWDDTATDEVLDSPPAVISCDVIDWYDAWNIQRVVKNHLRHGTVRRTYTLPFAYPFYIGQQIAMNQINAPGGKAIPYRQAINSRVIDWQIVHNAGENPSVSTQVTIEGSLVD